MDIGKSLAGIRCLNAVAAGTSVQPGTAVDMTGYDGVIFVALFGVITATAVTTLKAQQGAASDGSDAADLAGTGSVTLTATTDNNKVLVLDIFRPQGRYVRPVVLRATANAVIDGVFAFLYKALKEPVVDDATTVLAKKTVISPALGTP